MLSKSSTFDGKGEGFLLTIGEGGIDFCCDDD